MEDRNPRSLRRIYTQTDLESFFLTSKYTRVFMKVPEVDGPSHVFSPKFLSGGTKRDLPQIRYVVHAVENVNGGLPEVGFGESRSSSFLIRK